MKCPNCEIELVQEDFSIMTDQDSHIEESEEFVDVSLFCDKCEAEYFGRLRKDDFIRTDKL